MLEKLSTERRNPKTMDLDTKPIRKILQIMNEEDASVPLAVGKELDQIEKAVTFAIESFKVGGRLIYIGAGTSGRLGILDASECPPTFGVDHSMVQGIIAGGLKALTTSVEGAEDYESLGGEDLKALQLSNHDTVVGIAASGRTPYVIGALKYAKSVGAKTVSISNNKNSLMSVFSDVSIEVDTGPEVIAGSTRLKAGTAQKLVINMISTTAMIGIGKVYENLMVDVQPSNMKLVERAKSIIMEATGTDYETAGKYLELSRGHVKEAIVMILLKCSYEEAIERLRQSGGFIRKTLKRNHN